MKIKLKYLTLSIILIANVAKANISIYPFSVDFKDGARKRVQSIRIINSSNEIQTYRVSMVDFAQDEKGKLVEIKGAENSATPYVTFSPRQFTLQPKDVQTVNVARRSIAKAKDGEYVSHLKISEVNLGSPKLQREKENSETISMKIDVLFAVTIPVTVEKGDDLVAKTSLIGWRKVGNDKLNITLKREGNKSSRVNAYVLDKKNQELGKVKGIKIYMTTDTLNIDIPLNKNVTNENALLKLEDAQSEKEILRQSIKL